MRIAVYGAGAIGGLIAARLAEAGQPVAIVARGPHLAAIRANGLRLISGDADFTVRIEATDDAGTLGPQDAVIVTLKAQSVPGVVDDLRPLLTPVTPVVMAVNGVPWWYFYKLGGPHRDRQIERVDPAGAQWRGIRPDRAIGCVVYPAAEIVEPGVIRHADGDRLSLGEPDGSRSERVVAISEALNAAGFKAPIKPDIRSEIWVKLWGNVAFNPISALTGATMGAIGANPGTHALARAAMAEAQAVAVALGVRLPISLDRRFEGAIAVGEHKTSMLQDLERGRSLELDAVVGAVIELGQIVGVATPTLDMLYGLVQLRAATRGS